MAPRAEASAAYKWWLIFMLWFVCFLNYADRQAISSVFPVLEKEFGFDKAQLGLIGSAFAWVYAAAAPFAGVLADRVARKRIIISACIVWSIFTLGTGWCGAFAAFVAVRALTGLGETFYFPAAMSLISDYHSPQTRSKAMSLHQSAVYAGTILGSWMAAVLAEKSGWRIPFYVFGPLGILLATVLFYALRETKRGAADSTSLTPTTLARSTKPLFESGRALSLPQGGAPTPACLGAAAPPKTGYPSPPKGSLPVGKTLAIILRTPVALLLMLAFLAANFVAVIFLTWTPTFLVNKFHFSLGAAGLSGTIYIHLGSALSVPLAGYLADRIAARWSGGRMAVQASGLVVGAIFVFLVGTTNSTTTLVFAMSLFGICKGFYDSGIFASLYDTIEPRARGTAAGIMNTVGWGGGALGPLFVGLATKYGNHKQDWMNMSDAIAWCGAVYVIAAVLVVTALLRFMKNQRPQTPNH